MVSPIMVQKYLKGTKYPASKSQLVDTAKKQGADKDIMAAIEGLPDQEYGRPTDVVKSISGKSGSAAGKKTESTVKANGSAKGGSAAKKASATEEGGSSGKGGSSRKKST